METYRAFGLIIRSEIPLPSLISAQAELLSAQAELLPAQAKMPDLEIVEGPVEPDGLSDGIAVGRFAQSRPGQVWLHVPGVARFLIADGNRITVAAEPGADAQTVRLYLLGSGIGAVMHQRGRLILHGSALRFGDRAVAFAGASGAGKSTLTAGLHLRGHDLLADDLCVLDEEGRVQPGIPHIKLWADAVHRLGLEPSGMIRIRAQIDKYAWRMEERFCDRPLPLSAVYILHTHNRPEVLVEPATGIGKFAPLRNHTYRNNHLKGLGLQAQHLQLCGRLANKIRLVHITRPISGFSLDRIMDCVEADLHASLAPVLEAA